MLSTRIRLSSNKGQGLSLNTIVIAAIVLIVLLVLIAVFILGVGSFEGDVDGLSTKCSFPPHPTTNSCEHFTNTKLVYGNYKADGFASTRSATHYKLTPSGESYYKLGDKMSSCCLGP